MSVKQQDNGEWYCKGYVKSFDKTKKGYYNRLCDGAVTEQEAKDFEDIVRHNKKLETSGLIKKEEKKEIIRISRLKKELLEAAEEKELRTIGKITKHADFFINYFGKNKADNKEEKTKDIDIESITENDVREMRKYLLSQKTCRHTLRSKRTVNRYFSTLRRGFNILKSKGLIQYNPCDTINSYSEKDYFRTEHIPGDLIIEFIDSFPKPMDAILWTMFNTGFRIGSVFNMNVTQIDLTQDLIVLQSADNKGKRTVSAPINDNLRDILDEYLPKADYYLFVNPETGKPYTTIRGTFKSRIELLIEKLNKRGIYNTKITPHDIKRSLGLWLLEQGFDIVVIMELLHHTRVETTMAYLRITKDHIRKASNALPRRKKI